MNPDKRERTLFPAALTHFASIYDRNVNSVESGERPKLNLVENDLNLYVASMFSSFFS